MEALQRASAAPGVSEAVAALVRRVAENIAAAVQVAPETLEHLPVALVAEGHVLVEDYPGVGKTALARALAQSIDCHFARVQCTSDLLPADVVDANVYDRREQRFEFRPGPVFANIVLVDEKRRLAGVPGASEYVRALRLARFAGDGGRPSTGQRRALRRALRAGLGVAGPLRALWALPPRRAPRSPA